MRQKSRASNIILPVSKMFSIQAARECLPLSRASGSAKQNMNVFVESICLLSIRRSPFNPKIGFATFILRPPLENMIVAATKAGPSICLSVLCILIIRRRHFLMFPSCNVTLALSVSVRRLIVPLSGDPIHCGLPSPHSKHPAPDTRTPAPITRKHTHFNGL